jgi:hypothetical protein
MVPFHLRCYQKYKVREKKRKNIFLEHQLKISEKMPLKNENSYFIALPVFYLNNYVFPKNKFSLKKPSLSQY